MNILSVRYSVHRKNIYQIKTIIFEKNSTKYVSKEPYSNCSMEHIKNIYLNYELLKTTSSLQLVPPNLLHNKIIFPFVEGENFAALLVKLALEKDINNFKQKILWYKSLLENEVRIEFYETDGFNEIFGDGSFLKDMPSLKISNIDLNFENLIMGNDGKVTVIDYEWVFEFPIPLEYILYRVINLFAERYPSYLSNFILTQEIYELLGLDMTKLEMYAQMEESFKKFVAGEGGWYEYRGNYHKPVIDIEDINKVHDLNSQAPEWEQIQIFWDVDNGFSEDRSVTQEIINYETFTEYEFGLPNSSIRRLRVDIGTLPSYAEMEAILYCDQCEEHIADNLVHMEGLLLVEKNNTTLKFINTTNDPQLIFENDCLLREGKKKLKIRLYFSLDNINDKISFISERYRILEKGDIIKNEQIKAQNEQIRIQSKSNQALKQNLEDQATLLKEKEKLIETQIDLLGETNKKLEDITQLYNRMISTKGWKLLEKIRRMNIIKNKK